MKPLHCRFIAPLVCQARFRYADRAARTAFDEVKALPEFHVEVEKLFFGDVNHALAPLIRFMCPIFLAYTLRYA